MREKLIGRIMLLALALLLAIGSTVPAAMGEAAEGAQEYTVTFAPWPEAGGTLSGKTVYTVPAGTPASSLPAPQAIAAVGYAFRGFAPLPASVDCDITVMALFVPEESAGRLAVFAADSAVRVYDGTEQRVSGYAASLDGTLLPFDNGKAGDASATFRVGGGIKAEGAGIAASDTPYPVTFSGAYAISEGTRTIAQRNIEYVFLPGSLWIVPRPVTLAIKDVLITEGEPLPGFEVTIASGSLAGGDTIADLGITISVDGEGPGEHPIVVTAANTNYAVSTLPAKVTVSQMVAITDFDTPLAAPEAEPVPDETPAQPEATAEDVTDEEPLPQDTPAEEIIPEETETANEPEDEPAPETEPAPVAEEAVIPEESPATALTPVMEAIDSEGGAYVVAERARLYETRFLTRRGYLGLTEDAMLLATGYTIGDHEAGEPDVIYIVFLTEEGAEFGAYVAASDVALMDREEALRLIPNEASIEWPWPTAAYTPALEEERTDALPPEEEVVSEDVTEEEINRIAEQIIQDNRIAEQILNIEGTVESEVEAEVEVETETEEEGEAEEAPLMDGTLFIVASPAELPAYYDEAETAHADGRAVYAFRDYFGGMQYRVYGIIGEYEGFFESNEAGDVPEVATPIDPSMDPIFVETQPLEEEIPEFYSVLGEESEAGDDA